MHKLLLLTLCVPVLAQKFDVASIKPNNSGTFGTRIEFPSNGRFAATGITARQLIVQAYGLQDFQLSGGPGWLSSDRFDIEAKAEEGFTRSRDQDQGRVQNQAMLQDLLADRFHLRVRREMKELPIYNLVVDKGGSKLKLSADQTPPVPDPLPPGGPGTLPRGAMRMAPGYLSASGVPMSLFIRPVSAQLSRPLVDKTGLTGLFDIEFRWTPDRIPQLPPGVEIPPVDPNGPTIFTAMQEQLGLRLESATGPMEVIVIEKVEKPSEN